MRKIALFASSFPLLAAAASDVKVNSFRLLDSKSTAAEICGELVAPTGNPTLLKVRVDVGSKIEVPYYIWSGKDGKFCAIVSTVNGTAEVELQ